MKNNFTQALKELTGFDNEPNMVETEVREDVVSFEEVVNTSSDEKTHITSTMVIKGDIKSKDNVLNEGEIFGEVETSENITSSGLVIGNVSARNMLMNGARLRGNINLEGNLSVKENSVIVGNVNCDNLDLEGKVKGDCEIKAFAKMGQNAYLLGNVVADDIQTEQGAKIIGTITTRTGDLDMDSDFDFGGEF